MMTRISKPDVSETDVSPKKMNIQKKPHRYLGAIQVLPNTDGGGEGGQIFRKKRYEGVMFNVISVTRGWVGVQFPEK